MKIDDLEYEWHHSTTHNLSPYFGLIWFPWMTSSTMHFWPLQVATRTTLCRSACDSCSCGWTGWYVTPSSPSLRSSTTSLPVQTKRYCYTSIIYIPVLCTNGIVLFDNLMVFFMYMYAHVITVIFFSICIIFRQILCMNMGNC